jgi:hypothetical protein
MPSVNVIHVKGGSDLALLTTLPMCTTVRDVLDRFDMSHNYLFYVGTTAMSLDTVLYTIREKEALSLSAIEAQDRTPPRKMLHIARNEEEDEEQEEQEEEEEGRKKKTKKRTRAKTTTTTKQDLKRMDYTTEASRWIVRTVKNMGRDVVPFEIPMPTKQGTFNIAVPIHVSLLDHYEGVLDQTLLTSPCFLNWHLYIIPCGESEEEQHEEYRKVMTAHESKDLKNYLRQ